MNHFELAIFGFCVYLFMSVPLKLRLMRLLDQQADVAIKNKLRRVIRKAFLFSSAFTLGLFISVFLEDPKDQQGMTLIITFPVLGGLFFLLLIFLAMKNKFMFKVLLE